MKKVRNEKKIRKRCNDGSVLNKPTYKIERSV